MSRETTTTNLKQLQARLLQLDDDGKVYHFNVVSHQEDSDLVLELVSEGSDLPEIRLTLEQDDEHAGRAGSSFTVTETSDSRPLQPFTVWCRQSNDTGTTWISPVIMARDMAHAGTLALRQCSADWGMGEDNIAVVGVAKGDVEILTWNDL